MNRFFPNETTLVYQASPSIRIQYPGNTVVPFHYDSDEFAKHPEVSTPIAAPRVNCVPEHVPVQPSRDPSVAVTMAPPTVPL